MFHDAIVLIFLTLASPGEYNVKDFGAKGDSRTNDRAGIQAAIDACHNVGGGEVVVPPGTKLPMALAPQQIKTFRLSLTRGELSCRS